MLQRVQSGIQSRMPGLQPPKQSWARNPRIPRLNARPKDSLLCREACLAGDGIPQSLALLPIAKPASNFTPLSSLPRERVLLISAGEKRPAAVPPPFRGHGGPPAPKAPKTAATDSASQSKSRSSQGNRPTTKASSSSYSKSKSTHSSSKGGKKGGSSKSSGGGGKRSAPSSAKGKSAEKQGSDKQ